VVFSGYSDFIHHYKPDCHNIAEILLKVALKRHNLKPETLGEKQKYQTFIILFTLFGKRIEPVFEMKGEKH
jgi:hypothetical protein